MVVMIDNSGKTRVFNPTLDSSIAILQNMVNNHISISEAEKIALMEPGSLQKILLNDEPLSIDTITRLQFELPN